MIIKNENGKIIIELENHIELEIMEMSLLRTCSYENQRIIEAGHDSLEAYIEKEEGYCREYVLNANNMHEKIYGFMEEGESK